MEAILPRGTRVVVALHANLTAELPCSSTPMTLQTGNASHLADSARPRKDAGNGHIQLDLHGQEAVFSKLSYQYPLKLLSPRISEPGVAIAYVLTYGGGLVSGDNINLNIHVSSGTSLVMLTQVRRVVSIAQFC